MTRAKRRSGQTSVLFDLEPPQSDAPPFASCVEVALNRPVRREFTYAVPADLEPRVAVGKRVAVPFGPSRQVGVVVATRRPDEVPAMRLRLVIDVLDDEPIVDEGLLGLTRWIADRYACAWGEALAAVLPTPLKHERETKKTLMIRANASGGDLAELVSSSEKQHRLLRTLIEMGGEAELREILKRVHLSVAPARTLARRGLVTIRAEPARPDLLLSESTKRSRPERLSPHQQRAVDAIHTALGRGRSTTYLLHGVTGSGKTEVYLRAIEEALALGRGAIVLVPEIALTPQTVGWFRSRFGEIAVLHSRMTDAQRLEMWLRAFHGAARVVVGARSAVFAPVPRLGVIVVDEEHEPSFKQANTPRYLARDVAVERARRAGAVCILGSATPSLESWVAARTGAYERLELPERVGGGSMPAVHVVDMRLERGDRGEPPMFSRLLARLLEETVSAKEQAILFLNRRGFVAVMWCQGCREALRCGSCDVTLTWHRRIRRLVCHACCEESVLPPACPRCTRPGMKPLGFGSERVESALEAVVPGVRVRRMDSDTMLKREDYEDALGAFGRREVDVLVGTQMIAKGLDFPRVTLVGIVSADQGLHLPDFRAAERTFQLVAQVAGRAGRGALPGRIVVQTTAPDHPAIAYSSGGDYRAFAAAEERLRAELGYPPHGRLLRILFEDEDEQRAAEAARCCAARLREALGDAATKVLGPAPAPVAQLRGRHRHHLLVKAPPGDPDFERAVALLVDEGVSEARLAPKLDVDPMSML
jgi:primosomal protein N' (replication factor Y)